jgi:phosphohistidine phosphatase
MNRVLTIIRHAKAIKDLTLDIERPLSEAGKKDLETIKDLLFKKKIKADMVLCSTAKRAKETAEPIAAKLDTAPENIIYNQDIYLAPLQELLKIIENVPETVMNLIIVGHNPAITELARFVSKKYHEVLAPGNFISVELKLENWADIQKAEVESIKLANIT